MVEPIEPCFPAGDSADLGSEEKFPCAWRVWLSQACLRRGKIGHLDVLLYTYNTHISIQSIPAAMDSYKTSTRDTHPSQMHNNIHPTTTQKRVPCAKYSVRKSSRRKRTLTQLPESPAFPAPS